MIDNGFMVRKDPNQNKPMEYDMSLGKLYKAKSSANRAGKKALEAAPEGSTMEIDMEANQFFYTIITPKKEEKATPLKDILRASTIESPCQVVWVRNYVDRGEISESEAVEMLKAMRNLCNKRAQN